MRYEIKMFTIISFLICSGLLTYGNMAKKIEVIDLPKVIRLGLQNELKVTPYQVANKQVEKDWIHAIKVNT